MAIPLNACLQNAAGVVDPARVPLQAQEHLLCGSRAVDATRRVRGRIVADKLGGARTMGTEDSPSPQDDRCGCGSRSMPAEGEALGESGRSRLHAG
jgi:hypothetical protein